MKNFCKRTILFFLTTLLILQSQETPYVDIVKTSVVSFTHSYGNTSIVMPYIVGDNDSDHTYY